MNQWHQYIFYEQALEVRDLDRDTADLILEAESIDIHTATMLECKLAVVRWQYISEDEPGEWLVRSDALSEKVAEVRQTQE